MVEYWETIKIVSADIEEVINKMTKLLNGKIYSKRKCPEKRQSML
jgi:hypothetical protein